MPSQFIPGKGKSKKFFVLILAVVNIFYLSALGVLWVDAEAAATSPGKGKIEIFKEAWALTDRSFVFYSDLGDFSLQSGQRAVFDELEPGNYSFGEIVPAGWTLTDIECAGDFYPNSVINVAAGHVTLGLDAGEKLLCKFINHPTEDEEKGSITVRKYLDTDGLASTTGDRSLAAGSWTFSLFDGTATTSQATVGGATVFGSLDAGQYRVSETLSPGYALLEPVGNQYLIDLDQGEHVEIEFVNYLDQEEEIGTSSIKVWKYIDADGLASTTDDRVLATSSVWTFILFDGSATTSAQSSGGLAVFSNLAAGQYHVSEQMAGGFALLDPAGNHAPVNIAEGEEKEISFVNYRLSEPDTGSITVRKFQDADGLASTTADRSLVTSVWTFSVGNGTATSSQATVNGQAVFSGLLPGEYTISETLLSGWLAVEPAGGIATASLAANEDLTVDFANYQLPTPTPSGNGGGGGGGGGGGLPLTPTVRNDQINNAGCDFVIVSWLTSQAATSRLIYDTVSRPSIVGQTGPNYGYQFSIAENPALVTGHLESAIGLTIGQDYFLRTVSRFGSTEIVGPELAFSTLPLSLCVLGEAGAPDLTITKQFLPEVVDAGAKNVEFRITVRNIGNLAAFNVLVSDQLPAGFVYSDDQLDLRIVDLDDLVPGELAQFSLFVDVDGDIESGTYVNTASVSADNADTKTAQDSVLVRRPEVLAASGFSLLEFQVIVAGLFSGLGASAWLRRRYQS